MAFSRLETGRLTLWRQWLCWWRTIFEPTFVGTKDFGTTTCYFISTMCEADSPFRCPCIVPSCSDASLGKIDANRDRHRKIEASPIMVSEVSRASDWLSLTELH
jgi:hypothetical protein